MDLVTDLTSQCVSFTTVIQEVYKTQLKCGSDKNASLSTVCSELKTLQFSLEEQYWPENRIIRVSELMWTGKDLEKNTFAYLYVELILYKVLRVLFLQCEMSC